MDGIYEDCEHGDERFGGKFDPMLPMRYVGALILAGNSLS